MTAENLQRYRDLKTRSYTTGLSDDEQLEIEALWEEYIGRPAEEWTAAERAVMRAWADMED